MNSGVVRAAIGEIRHIDRRYNEVRCIVVMAASAGGLEPIKQIVAALPVPCGAAVFIARHIGCGVSILPKLLAAASGMPSAHGHHGAPIKAGHIYVAPPDCHMTLTLGNIWLDRTPKQHHTRPAADRLFYSAAKAYGPAVVGIVLSGGGSDGASGLRTIKELGGLALVQSLESAWLDGMPSAAIRASDPDAVLSVAEIARTVAEMCA